jgi:FtsH-binding integral membrane protein
MSNAYTYTDSFAQAESRAGFIRRTYTHLAGALLAFALLLTCFLSIPAMRLASEKLLGNKLGWLLILGAFMGASYYASKLAHDFTSRKTQYQGLALFVVLEALLFTPLMSLVLRYGKPGIIPQSLLVTLGLFLALSAVVFITKHRFSWLKTVVTVGGIVAIAAIIASAIFGFSLGFFFICAMIVLMAASILHKTGEIMTDYPEWAYVGAALTLFSSFATLLWYVLQFFMSSSRD